MPYPAHAPRSRSRGARTATLARGVTAMVRLERRARRPRQALERFQQDRLRALIDFAATRSPFYAELYGGRERALRTPFTELPVVAKPQLMASFDAWVSDRKLRLDDVLAHLNELGDDDLLYRGRYRVMGTGGASGARGVFLYNPREWATVVGGALRWTRMLGVRPGMRVAVVGASGPVHMTSRISMSVDIGLYPTLRLAASAPLNELVAALNEFQPQWLQAYASLARVLAQAQRTGGLAIQPTVVSTAAELRSDATVAAIRSAWGTQPFDLYGITEVGVFGAECDRHRGMHVFEDLALIELLNADGQPAAPGEPAARFLLTNLTNRTQPLIRYEVDDIVAIAEERCTCGRPFVLLEPLRGRRDELLRLPGAAAGEVEVHPIVLRGAIETEPAVEAFEVVQRAGGLLVRIVAPSAAGDLEASLGRTLRARLRQVGVAAPTLAIERVPVLKRSAGSEKQMLVREG